MANVERPRPLAHNRFSVAVISSVAVLVAVSFADDFADDTRGRESGRGERPARHLVASD